MRRSIPLSYIIYETAASRQLDYDNGVEQWCKNDMLSGGYVQDYFLVGCSDFYKSWHQRREVHRQHVEKDRQLGPFRSAGSSIFFSFWTQPGYLFPFASSLCAKVASHLIIDYSFKIQDPPITLACPPIWPDSELQTSHSITYVPGRLSCQMSHSWPPGRSWWRLSCTISREAATAASDDKTLQTDHWETETSKKLSCKLFSGGDESPCSCQRHSIYSLTQAGMADNA